MGETPKLIIKICIGIIFGCLLMGSGITINKEVLNISGFDKYITPGVLGILNALAIIFL